ncbi:MAG: hypothetical protein HN742_26050 [Lentisphaerae bacterium]|jgi:hypothetical protein|nr:hypothetical protein [Lentisphaerota bacterium]MBT4816369.1 hypothetical protein [Lentisphaerota bacterium]MBT5605573.1 hypothetical protein [Lentisphaerota bacterium]MBT7056850.1 hypothetical protein [Lentisphaerota bacterium]MBT7845364.1 hypothetical protein [Lentisphaerota bacterium]
MRALVVLLSGLVSVAASAASPVLAEWQFDRPEDGVGWGRANHVADVRAEGGALKGRLLDWDPWVTSPQFEITATPWQKIEFRLRTDCGGSGQVFFTNTTESEHGGFFPKKNVPWDVIGDGQWHTYTVHPFWGKENKIIMIRLDFAKAVGDAKGKATFELDWLRIVGMERPATMAKPPVWTFPAALDQLAATGTLTATPKRDAVILEAAAADAWLDGPFTSFLADDGFWAVVQLATTAGETASLRWISSQTNTRPQLDFEVIPDGRMRTYNVDLSARKTWQDDIYFVAFRPPVGKGKTTLAEIAIADEPGGPAVPVIRYAGLEDAINRAGRPASFLVTMENRGGEPISGGKITRIELPRGVSVVGPESWRDLPGIGVFDIREHRFQLVARQAVEGEFRIVVEAAGEAGEYTGEVRFDPRLDLPKADYVPEPQPVASDYDVGALYFPGWPTLDRWARIWPTDPQRKPVLGWYDEANPEVVDWQIKWAVENGIKYFMVDWYWHKGSMHLEHWIRAYEKARYRRFLKWCMMYANHNRAGSHSEADQRAVTTYWIDNFFHMPEYYRIDDKPVVMYWSPSGLKRDMGGEGGAGKLLEISRQMARDAGYKGIHFIAMKWPEASTKAEDVQWLKSEGFDMTSLYHFMDHGGKAANPRRFSFDLVADCSHDWWKARQETGILPFIPNLSTGWHSRPWHGGRGIWIDGRTPALFRRICEDGKRFADETGVKRLVLAPINEWGEGSYAEPCKEFGFGMYEAVRDTFARKPKGGWPMNYGPSDVGLGPYDLADVTRKDRTQWDFSDGTQGWNRAMGIGEFVARDGVLQLRTSSVDPAIFTSLGKIRARNYKRVVVRMKVSPFAADSEDGAQLFWSTLTASISEPTSSRAQLAGDGEFHDYVFPVAENPRWRGRLQSFRFDPSSREGVAVEIAEIRMEK